MSKAEQLAPAAAAQGCLLGSDCVTGQCKVTAPSADLKYTSCVNGVKVDRFVCGGATCSTPCVLGDGCAADSDCSTGNCDATTNVCRQLTAADMCGDTELIYFEKTSTVAARSAAASRRRAR
jgi:hypothetical protein